MAVNPSIPDPQRPVARRWPGLAPRLLLALLPVALLCVGEWIARTVQPKASDDPHLNLWRPRSIFSKVDVNGQEWYQVTHPDAYRSSRVRFPVVKPPGTFRMFCVGESASAGWPHPPGESWSNHLETSLRTAFPARPIEVLNVGAHAYASYRIRLIFDDIIEFEPDLIALWVGNNEFLERRSYGAITGRDSALAEFARSSRLVLLLNGLISRWLDPEATLSGAARESSEFEQWTKIRRMALDLRADPVQFDRVKDHYSWTLRSMVEEAERRGIPVFLFTVPVNLRDWRPIVSHHSLSDDALARFVDSFDAARAKMLRGDAVGAIVDLDAAVALDPGHAETWYVRGRAYEALGREDEARAEYGRARDLDFNPFRALGEMNEGLRLLAQRHRNTTLLDLEREFDLASPRGSPGFELFLDYVHPSREGNLLVAATVFDAIVAANLLGPRPSTSPLANPAPTAGDGAVYEDARDAVMQGQLLRLCCMMHQYESAIEKAKLVIALDESGLPPQARDARLARAVVTTFPDWLDVERRRLLGEEMRKDERRDAQASMDDLYQAHFANWELAR